MATKVCKHGMPTNLKELVCKKCVKEIANKIHKRVVQLEKYYRKQTKRKQR